MYHPSLFFNQPFIFPDNELTPSPPRPLPPTTSTASDSQNSSIDSRLEPNQDVVILLYSVVFPVETLGQMHVLRTVGKN